METSAKVIEILILSDDIVLVTFSDGTIATLESFQIYRLAVDLKVLKPATRELDDDQDEVTLKGHLDVDQSHPE
jgi:hypothetical protein